MENGKREKEDAVLSVEFEVTPLASQKIQAISEKENKVGYGLRVRAFGGGCSGPQYQLGLEEKESEGDTVLQLNGLRVFIDPETAGVVQAAKLDFIEGPNGSGFKVTTVGEGHGGGCGSHGDDHGGGGGGCGCGSGGCGSH